MNLILVIRLIIILCFWTIVFFPAVFVPLKWQYKLFWPIFTRLFLFASKIKPYYIGKPDIKNIENVIFAINHRSFADTFILAYFLRKNFIITYINWMAKNIAFKFFNYKMGLIPLDHNDYLQQKESISKIIKSLDKKNSIIYFPEGKFNFDSPVAPLKRGIAKIARKSSVIVVPVVIYGAGMTKDFLHYKKCKWKKVFIDTGHFLRYSDFDDEKSFLSSLSTEMNDLYIKMDIKYRNDVYIE